MRHVRPDHPSHGSHHPRNASILLAYLHSQQMIRPVTAMGLGLDTADWTRFWTETPPTPILLARGVGHGGMRARDTMRRDLINLCQNSQGLLQAPTMAL